MRRELPPIRPAPLLAVNGPHHGDWVFWGGGQRLSLRFGFGPCLWCLSSEQLEESGDSPERRVHSSGNSRWTSYIPVSRWYVSMQIDRGRFFFFFFSFFFLFFFLFFFFLPGTAALRHAADSLQQVRIYCTYVPYVCT